MRLSTINDPDFPSTNSFSGPEVPNVILDIVSLPGKDRPARFPPFPSGRIGDPDTFTMDFGHLSLMDSNAHERVSSTEAVNHLPHSAITPSMQHETPVEASISQVMNKEPRNVELRMEESLHTDLEDEIIQILTTTCTADATDIATSASLMVTLSEESSSKSLEKMVESLKPHSKFPISAIADKISAIRAPVAGRPISGSASSKTEEAPLSSSRQSPQPMDVDDDSPNMTKEPSLAIVFDPPSGVHTKELSMKIKPKLTFKYALTYSQTELSKPNKAAVAALQRSTGKKVEGFPNVGDVWIHTNRKADKYWVWQYITGSNNKDGWSDCTASYERDTGTIIHPKHASYTLSRNADASHDDPAYLTTSWVVRRRRDNEIKRQMEEQAAEAARKVAQEQAAELARLADEARKSANSQQSASARVPWRAPSGASQPSSSRSRRRRVTMEEITDDEN
ncbi:uncharacterized protein LACBIDRAFT_334834 [Laccaria bicolor S238N-H82]|uniref:Predicted protein n=1 Tax=Laccaria bicolor (strain S238N-H82 / ATCC MYA-4686) TaxID=486041 RepID=B0E0H7_LACBS|nr:uncharacterized protein LACBIDRAFT_334834 [Laccaria bicolor S238N-H82]EDQ99719.1 predicted protein [Laccaria bicolor S238N-H82]|eukprot:XP_001889696.1 predicted protein [Laccaria bicolor S238N-H82]